MQWNEKKFRENEVIFTIFGVSFFVDLNQPAIFTCTVTGYPRQHVYWIKNGQTFQLDGHR